MAEKMPSSRPALRRCRRSSSGSSMIKGSPESETVGDVALAGLFRSAHFAGGVFAGPIHQQQLLLVLHQPEIYRLSFEEFAHLGGDDGIELIHFQGGVEDFFHVVKLGQARDGFEMRVAFGLVVGCARKGGSGIVDQFDQPGEIRFD